jgi:hypothetical protein
MTVTPLVMRARHPAPVPVLPHAWAGEPPRSHEWGRLSSTVADLLTEAERQALEQLRTDLLAADRP